MIRNQTREWAWKDFVHDEAHGKHRGVHPCPSQGCPAFVSAGGLPGQSQLGLEGCPWLRAACAPRKQRLRWHSKCSMLPREHLGDETHGREGQEVGLGRRDVGL